MITPVLPVPLTGPAYFVSHGGEAFPDLTIVLQGYGVTIDLVGSTQIKAGITTSTFKSTPDVPFSSFELTLPQGKFSVLAANANLCKSKLLMPTELTAQNGVVHTQQTKISVTGCAKAPSRRQQLQKALKACHKKHSSSRRKACEAQARRRFGVHRRRLLQEEVVGLACASAGPLEQGQPANSRQAPAPGKCRALRTAPSNAPCRDITSAGDALRSSAHALKTRSEQQSVLETIAPID